MIPTEIVNHVLGFLHSDQDFSTLKTCSAVFPQIADRLLYSEIGFFVYGQRVGVPLPSRKTLDAAYGVPPTEFSRILLNRPHIANYVRAVRIYIRSGAKICTTSQPILVLPSILPILLHIESISITANGSLSWRGLDPNFRAAFLNSIRSLSIKDVAITNIYYFSLDAFHDCKNLKRLVLDGNFIDGEDVSTSLYPRLCSLSVDNQTDPSCQAKVFSWVRGTLNTLSLRIPWEPDIPKFRPLIEACSTTLVNLELDLFFFSRESWFLRYGTRD